jgi:hypothetical protein
MMDFFSVVKAFTEMKIMMSCFLAVAGFGETV